MVFALLRGNKLFFVLCSIFYSFFCYAAQYKAQPDYYNLYKKSADENIKKMNLNPKPSVNPKPDIDRVIDFFSKDTGEQFTTYKTFGKTKIIVDKQSKVYEYDSSRTYEWLTRAGASFPIESELFIETEKGLGISHSLMAKLSFVFYDETFWGLHKPRGDSVTVPYRDNDGNLYYYAVSRPIYAMVVYPQISMAYRYYFNMQRRIRKKKNTAHRNGLYIALEPYIFLPKLFGIYDEERRYYANPQYGLFTYLGGAYTSGHIGLGFCLGVRVFGQTLYKLKDEYTLHSEPHIKFPLKFNAFIYYMF